MDVEASSGRLQHLGTRGSASLEPYDGERAQRLLSRYLGSGPAEWDPIMVTDPPEGANGRWTFVRISPEAVVLRVFSYPGGGR